MPTLPMVPTATANPSRRHAAGEFDLAKLAIARIQGTARQRVHDADLSCPARVVNLRGSWLQLTNRHICERLHGCADCKKSLFLLWARAAGIGPRPTYKKHRSMSAFGGISGHSTREAHCPQAASFVAGGVNAVPGPVIGAGLPPGGNLTGVTTLTLEVASKWLELLHELMPTASAFALLINPTSPALAAIQSRDLQAAARNLGVQVTLAGGEHGSRFRRGLCKSWCNCGRVGS